MNSGAHCGYFSFGLTCVFNVLLREVQVLETQSATGLVEGTSGEGQSGVVASTALIEKILSEDPRWQGESSLSTWHRNQPTLNSCHSSCRSVLISPHTDTSFVLSHYKTELCKKPPGCAVRAMHVPTITTAKTAGGALTNTNTGLYNFVLVEHKLIKFNIMQIIFIQHFISY